MDWERTLIAEFGRYAAIPLLIAAVVAAVLSGVLTAWADMPPVIRSMLASSAGAVGGMLGSALTRARERAEERKRGFAVLRTQLQELLGVLEADFRLIAEPITGGDTGELSTNSRLLSFTSRAKRTCERIGTLAAPSPIFDDELNQKLTRLRLVAEGGTELMNDAVAAAQTNPRTVEDFFIAQGLSVKAIGEASKGPLIQLLREVVGYKT